MLNMSALLRHWAFTSLFFGLIPLNCARHPAPHIEPSEISSALDTTRSDASPSHVRSPKRLFITVAPSIQLEVLDWGGQGPPLLFLAGYGNTALSSKTLPHNFQAITMFSPSRVEDLDPLVGRRQDTILKT